MISGLLSVFIIKFFCFGLFFSDWAPSGTGSNFVQLERPFPPSKPGRSLWRRSADGGAVEGRPTAQVTVAAVVGGSERFVGP